jgi:hypothetical protein
MKKWEIRKSCHNTFYVEIQAGKGMIAVFGTTPETVEANARLIAAEKQCLNTVQ